MVSISVRQFGAAQRELWKSFRQRSLVLLIAAVPVQANAQTVYNFIGSVSGQLDVAPSVTGVPVASTGTVVTGSYTINYSVGSASKPLILLWARNP